LAKQEAKIRALAEAMTAEMDEGWHVQELVAPIEEALLASMKLIEGCASHHPPPAPDTHPPSHIQHNSLKKPPLFLYTRH
jgi:hypothetical protein